MNKQLKSCKWKIKERLDGGLNPNEPIEGVCYEIEIIESTLESKLKNPTTLLINIPNNEEGGKEAIKSLSHTAKGVIKILIGKRVKAAIDTYGKPIEIDYSQLDNLNREVIKEYVDEKVQSYLTVLNKARWINKINEANRDGGE